MKSKRIGKYKIGFYKGRTKVGSLDAVGDVFSVISDFLQAESEVFGMGGRGWMPKGKMEKSNGKVLLEIENRINPNFRITVQGQTF